jgi:hypothetical protein
VFAIECFRSARVLPLAAARLGLLARMMRWLRFLSKIFKCRIERKLHGWGQGIVVWMTVNSRLFFMKKADHTCSIRHQPRAKSLKRIGTHPSRLPSEKRPADVEQITACHERDRQPHRDHFQPVDGLKRPHPGNLLIAVACMSI